MAKLHLILSGGYAFESSQAFCKQARRNFSTSSTLQLSVRRSQALQISWGEYDNTAVEYVSIIHFRTHYTLHYTNFCQGEIISD